MLRISAFLIVGVLSNYHVAWYQNKTITVKTTNTTLSLETTHKPIVKSQNHTEGSNSTVISVKNNTEGINDAANISSKNTSFTTGPLPTVPLEVKVTNLSTSTLSPIVCKLKNIMNPPYYQNKSCYSSSDALKCFHDPIFCKRHFKSGHRDLQDKRPTYGEYSLLKHQQWFHVIQHGGVAFLYHPCASEEEVVKMRQVASQCLHRHILAPYNKLTEDMPLALVSWGCYFISTSVHSAEMKAWIRHHAYRGPASHVHTNGKYNQNLLKKSEVITDVKDAIICPSKKQKFLFVPTQQPAPKQKQSVRDHESIIKNRVIKLNKIKPGITVMTNLTITKVKTGSAVWAAASLIFLCGILVGWLVYTRQLSGSGGGSHKYNPVNSCEKDSFECEPGESQFNMLKSNQKFMSAFRWRTSHAHGHKDLKDSMSTVHLMVPIDEEGDSEETMFFE